MTTLTLHNGDCLAVMKDISANSIDLIICDLPYGCLQYGGGKEHAKRKALGKEGVFAGCAWDIKIDLEKFWEQARRILVNEHSPVIHFCTTKFGAELIASNPSWFRYDLVYNKGRGVAFLRANKMPMRSHEMIYVFSKAGAFYNRIDISGNFPKGDEKRCALSVINIEKCYKKDQHPTEKPTELYRWLIERYSSPGHTILDPTFGSGNSVFTAFDMGRNAIGIEKDEGFYNKAVAKIA